MMKPVGMNLKILLPFKVFTEKKDVERIVAETANGSFGILPHRLDCVAALVPGILTYQTEADGEVFLAIDEGVLVKEGQDVYISVRNATGGADLGKLREAIEEEFLNLGEQEMDLRITLAKLESDFIRRFMEYHKK